MEPERYTPNEQEKVGLFLDGLVEPALLDHVRYRLHSRVVVVASKVEEDTERGDLAAFASEEFCEAVYAIASAGESLDKFHRSTDLRQGR